MTIVASNSLTLSNVNDGTITHVAYSWSSDGTDRFTTVYPGENLLAGTADYSYGLKGADTVVLTGDDGYNGHAVIKTTISPSTSSFIDSWRYSVPKALEAGTYTLSFKAKSSIDGAAITSYFYSPNTTISSENSQGFKRTLGDGTSNFTLTTEWKTYWITWKQSETASPKTVILARIFKVDVPIDVYITEPKFEPGINHDYIYTPEPSEDYANAYPTYMGTCTDYTEADSTNPSAYTWSLIRGNDGKDGQDGDPGKIVSDTEPSTRFKGLTWKYSGTADLTASDGTVILSGTEYYWSGTNWILNEINAHNINGNNLTITDGEFVSTTTNGPVTTSTEIKDNHIAISKTDGTVNTRNDIALDSEQGLAQKFTNINTGFYRTAGINYQGPFTGDSDGNYAQLTPQGTKLSTDVPWTKLSLMNNFTGNIEYAIINGTVYISASGVGVPAMSAGQWKQAAQLPTGSSAIPIRANRIAAGDSGDGLSWALLSNQAGGIFIRCSANKAATTNLFNATLPYPIG